MMIAIISVPKVILALSFMMPFESKPTGEPAKVWSTTCREWRCWDEGSEGRRRRLGSLLGYPEHE